MGQLLNIVNQLHRRTARDYVGRMADDKVQCSVVARRFDADYWDGDRRYGYGGYKYDGRWSVVAKQLVEQYKLKDGAKILDVGCGRGFLLRQFGVHMQMPPPAGQRLDQGRIHSVHSPYRGIQPLRTPQGKGTGAGRMPVTSCL